MSSFFLENNILKLQLQRPGSFYRGSRFCWPGQIVQIEYLGKHRFCTNESTDPAQLQNLGRGLYSEFGIESAVGYASCEAGGYFPKIGIGMLKKESEDPYRFFHPYSVLPSDHQVQIAKTSAVFTSISPQGFDFAWKLVKTVRLMEAGFTIRTELENTGSSGIATDEYVHNFLAIDDLPLGPEYRLSFPFLLKPGECGEAVNPEDGVRISESHVTWKSNPGEFFFGHIHGKERAGKSWTLIHQRELAGIRETTDFVPDKINVWGREHVVSPEMFYKIDLKPGEQTEWTRKYDIIEFHSNEEAVQ